MQSGWLLSVVEYQNFYARISPTGLRTNISAFFPINRSNRRRVRIMFWPCATYTHNCPHMLLWSNTPKIRRPPQINVPSLVAIGKMSVDRTIQFDIYSHDIMGIAARVDQNGHLKLLFHGLESHF
jgi:hypothetical protein